MFAGLFGEDDESVQVENTSSSVSLPRPPSPRNSTNLSGLSNLGATCYLNALLQTLFFTPEFRDGLFRLGPDELGDISDDPNADNSMVRLIPIQLQKLFSELLVVNQQSASVDALTSSFGWRGNEEMQQHDVQELNRILFMAIESSLTGTSGEQLISHIYHGTSVSKVICQKCGRVSGREEEFLDIPIALSGCDSLEERLKENFITMETLDGNNQYHCDSCDQLVDAKRGSRLNKLPPILTFALLRFLYDFEKGERYKDINKLSFPMVLDMAPYCDEVSQPMEYELFSVVIHGGSTHSGHYTAYIRDIDNLGHWNHPEEDPVQFQPQSESGSVDFINFDSPIDLVKELLAQHNGSATVDKVMSSLYKQTGVSWNSRFKKNHGTIVKFLKRHDDVFHINDVNCVTLKSPSTQATSGEEFESRVEDMETSETPSQGELVKGAELNPQHQHQQQHQQHQHQQQHQQHQHQQQYQQQQHQQQQQPEENMDESESMDVTKLASEETLGCHDNDQGKMAEKSDKHVHHAPKKQQRCLPPVGERWFEFNDVHVTPIHSKDIPKMFQGRKSAYMVFYRRRSLQRPPECSGNPSFGVPQRLIAEARTTEAKLIEERRKYDIAVNTITLNVFFSEDCRVQDGAIQYLPEEGSEVRVVDIDRRKPLSSLWKALQELTPSLSPSMGSRVLHTAKHLPSGMHLYDQIKDETDSQDLMTLGLKHGNSVFVWDSIQVGGEVIKTGTDSEPILLSIYYLDGQDHKEISKGFPLDMTLLELKAQLSTEVGIPPGNLSVSLISEATGGSRQQQSSSVTMFGNGKNQCTLRDLKLRDGDKLTAEKQMKKGTKTLAHSLADKQSKGVQLVVEDRFTALSEGESCPVITVDVDKEQNLSELKKIILKKIGVPLPCNDGRLRINDEFQGVGPPLHEDHTLSSLGLVQGSKLIFEPGAPPLSSEMILHFQFYPQNPKDQFFELVVDRTATIRQCLDQLIIAGDLGSDAWHLCKSNWCGERSDVIDDEESSIEQLRLNNGDLLFIESGKLPPKGYIHLPIYLHLPEGQVGGNHGDEVWHSLADTLKAGTSANEMMETSSKSPGEAGPDDKSKETPLHEQDPSVYYPPAFGQIRKIGFVEISKDSTVDELKTMIMTLPTLVNCVVPSLAFLRVRELVNGRLGKILKQSSLTLRRLKVGGNSKVCCSILNREEELR
jgi:ubiquitin carboxyl-terminal hydrolase 40